MPINYAGQFGISYRDALVKAERLLIDGRLLKVNTDHPCNFFAAWQYAKNGSIGTYVEMLY